MLYKFSGAGNDFVVLDGRGRDMQEYRSVSRITALCRRYATDGLMILDIPAGNDTVPVTPDLIGGPVPDFTMEFYNPDGTGGMMCGNGGRCIVAFADMLGLHPASPDGTWHFLAPDGPHSATILSRPSCHSEHPSCHSERSEESTWTVRLKMIDVQGVTSMMGGYFLNTGTRHFVKFVDDVDSIDVAEEGKRLRWDPAFQPEGANVNFVRIAPDGLHVRTFEKGVEGETLACGTGLTASAIAYGSPTNLQCRRGDWLKVEFTKNGTGAKDVFLTGPAECVSIL